MICNASSDQETDGEGFQLPELNIQIRSGTLFNLTNQSTTYCQDGATIFSQK